MSVTATPCARNHSASQATSGVLPVPPTVRLPTLITGASTRIGCVCPESNRTIFRLYDGSIYRLHRRQKPAQARRHRARRAAADQIAKLSRAEHYRRS